MKNVWKDFQLKDLDDFYDLYVQSEALLPGDIFENFFNKYIETELDPAQFLSVPGLVWQVYFKKTEKELELLTDIDMLQMVKKESELEYVLQYINMPRQIINI